LIYRSTDYRIKVNFTDVFNPASKLFKDGLISEIFLI
jgi:hypothetical protein